MVDILNIYQICPQCKGVKEIQEGYVPDLPDGDPPVQFMKTCPMCEGEGEIKWGQMREEEEE